MKYENPRQIRVSDIRIQDSFWSKVQNLMQILAFLIEKIRVQVCFFALRAA